MNENEKYGIGKIFKTNKYGEIEIVEKIDYNRRKILFLEHNEYSIANLSNINKCNIIPPSKKDLYQIGMVFDNNLGDKFEIVQILGKNRRLIKFFGFNELKNVNTGEIKKGSIKNNFNPNICGVGFLGIDINKNERKSDKYKKFYSIWHAMIHRCYNEKRMLRYPTYRHVTVCIDWQCFKNFYIWAINTHPSDLNNLNLDKDLLQYGVEKKIYSPETCCWLPTSINAFIANNQPRYNTSGYTGVSENTNKKGYWRAQINDYDTGKYICIKYDCESKEEAYELYKEYRAKNAEKVKEYLRSLNYLSEDIIGLVR